MRSCWMEARHGEFRLNLFDVLMVVLGTCFVSRSVQCTLVMANLALQAKSPENQGPSRVMAQALMKRAIADIPIVTHIQKESAGMNKLYSQSMCSVKQWRAYQNAETMVSQEVEEVRAEADEIEPGWSQVREIYLGSYYSRSL